MLLIHLSLKAEGLHKGGNTKESKATLHQMKYKKANWFMKKIAIEQNDEIQNTDIWTQHFMFDFFLKIVFFLSRL